MKCEREYHIFSKRRYVAGLLLIIAAALIFVENDAFLYKNTIARVVSVDNTFSHVQDGPNEEAEKYYDQEIQAKVLKMMWQSVVKINSLVIILTGPDRL